MQMAETRDPFLRRHWLYLRQPLAESTVLLNGRTMYSTMYSKMYRWHLVLMFDHRRIFTAIRHCPDLLQLSKQR